MMKSQIALANSQNPIPQQIWSAYLNTGPVLNGPITMHAAMAGNINYIDKWYPTTYGKSNQYTKDDMINGTQYVGGFPQANCYGALVTGQSVVVFRNTSSTLQATVSVRFEYSVAVRVS